MKAGAALLLALLAARGHAAIAFVSDELVLGVFAEPESQGQKLATLHSGATLDTLQIKGDFTQVRLPDGITGWVKSSFLTTHEPATVRVKRLEEELDQSRATSPELADAAQRSELEHLREDIGAKQSQLESLSKARPARVTTHWWQAITLAFAALTVGFVLGYATLARRIRQKFGGVKVY